MSRLVCVDPIDGSRIECVCTTIVTLPLPLCSFSLCSHCHRALTATVLSLPLCSHRLLCRYHEQPEYENVKQLLEAPKIDMKELVEGRIPVSRLIETDQHKSQSRCLS